MSARKTSQTSQEAGFWDRQTQVRRRTFRRNWYTEVNRRLWDGLMSELGGLEGRRVLFVGCGESGAQAKEMARRGGDVWCVDVSARALGLLMSHPFGELQAKVHPVIANAERMPFCDDFFDVVVGKAIVHHLNIRPFMKELRRVCVPDAKIVFSEPLGTNPFINLFRRMTPGMRVPTEHPLRPSDLREIASYCRSLHLHYSDWLSMASFPWFFAGLHSAGSFVYRAMRAAESVLFRVVPPARWLAWCVLIVGFLEGQTQKNRVAGDLDLSETAQDC